MSGKLIRISDNDGKHWESTIRKAREVENLDEFVAEGADLHVEGMNDKSVWIGIDVQGRHYALWLFVKRGKLHMRVSDEGSAFKPKRKKKAAATGEGRATDG